MADCLEDLASKYPGTKFVKIVSTDCIPNYPDSNLPTLLVYFNGAVKKNITGLASFGGKHATSESKPYAPLQIALVCMYVEAGWSDAWSKHLTCGGQPCAKRPNANVFAWVSWTEVVEGFWSCL